LAFPPGHQPGSSNTTQSYSPGAQSGSSGKKSFSRPKSSEPGSPLLRRALSPDRLHPRSAESKTKSCPTTISPLCDPALKVTISSAPRVTITSKSPSLQKISAENEIMKSKPPEHPLRKEKDRRQSDNDIVIEESDVDFVSLASTSQPLPRIAEEKDSPTAIKDDLPQNPIKTVEELSLTTQLPCSQVPPAQKSKNKSLKNICGGRKAKKDFKDPNSRL
jgi:microtubule-associated serine/threonine kinase